MQILKKFDVICASDVLEHLIDPKKIVKKAYKYLKKNGLIFVYVFLIGNQLQDYY